MLFPMYTVRLEAVLQMVEIEPHEHLKAKDILVEFSQDLGNAAFVSHQWVGNGHPDPDFKQFRVLQEALRHVMSDLSCIPPDVFTEAHVPSTKSWPTWKLRSAPLFIWYDCVLAQDLGQSRKIGSVKVPELASLGTYLGIEVESRSAGEGDFTVADDRLKLVKTVHELVPGFKGEPGLDSQPVGQFLFQNGFVAVDEADAAGWKPLHYAALRGNTSLLLGLLEARANINAGTKKDQPLLGQPAGSSALNLALAFRNNDVARLLVGAKANFTRRYTDAAAAAMSNNPEGIRMLSNAGYDLTRTSFFHLSPLDVAAGFGSLEALEELVASAGPALARMDMSRALFSSAALRGGSAAQVQRLLELRADVNAAFSVNWTTWHGLVVAVMGLRHRLGTGTAMTSWAYHLPGQTPLMAAVMSGQYEGAAALVAAGARLDLRNWHGWTVSHFARERSVPDFLMEAFQGQLEGCQRVSALAPGYVEECF
ncbi:anks1b [Symbiodinium pilosum]|uniref:Anks1b protein n=1 Tax=Symbiodinium pilosum TaxID=2952 RepID=A0A812KEY0_SYMPI|nr:anks1b [Symbiodinium pilosum]